MAAPSSSSLSAAKPPPLSYAERARRAGASQPPQTASRSRTSGHNGKTRSGEESSSPASSSRNLTPNSSVALTLPGSPPPSSSQTSIEEQQAFPPMPKSPSKPLTNVWTARKEQMARVAVQQQQQQSQGHASASVQTENSSSTLSSRTSVNGGNMSSSQDDATSADHDPFTVRIPPHGHVLGRTNASSASRTPPSLDDVESWPEMGKGVPSSSTSATGSIAETDRKDGSLKKAEKPKWVPMTDLQAPLQTPQDGHGARSGANSRAQSQHRRNNQANSRSRQQSQARSGHHQNQDPHRPQNQNYVAGMSNGSGAMLKAGEPSSIQSASGSATHSRTTSVHSSPRLVRGRRLPEERPLAPGTTSVDTGPSAASEGLANGASPGEEKTSSLRLMEDQSIPFVPAQRTYQNNPTLQSSSAPHSQSHTPYSHSPVYCPPLLNSGPQGYAYGPMPTSAGFPIPTSAPSPGGGGAPLQQQNYVAYTYGLPHQFAPGQAPFPYMYQPVPYTYYPAPMPDQLESRYQEGTQHTEPTPLQSSPSLPPASTVTRPPPPQESGPLSGYRIIAPVPVSPLLGGSAPRQSISELVEGTSDMVFGSVGQPGGLKSPSPVPVPPLAPCAMSVSDGQQEDRKIPTAFAVGFEGSTAIRVKRIASGKDGADEVADAIRVIDLTDKGSKWQFGTSVQELEPLPDDSGEQGNETYEITVQQQIESQIIQPQPHYMLHYPPPSASSTFQVGGYNLVPHIQLHHPSMPVTSQSPQSNVQLLPSLAPSLAPLPLNPGFVSPLALSSPGPAPQSAGPVPVHMSGFTTGGDEWEVRDFGYGFGQGHTPDRREERFERENYRDPRDSLREPRDYPSGRIRRSSTTGGHGGAYFEGTRGVVGGRRGRGQNGFGRGFGRGGFGGRGAHSNFQRHQPSLSVSTGPFQHQQNILQQTQVSSDVPNPNGYFVSPTTTTSQYLASPYGQINPSLAPAQVQSHPQAQTPSSGQAQSQYLQHPQAPPVPLPITALSFPLDPTRLYLLGQLEYYFSGQNLASDLFLRQQMDSRGWIPITLIASFNRVRHLTQDLQLVKEVLEISSLAEVQGDHVRLANLQWVNYVLPGAVKSTVEGEDINVVRPTSAEDAEKETEENEEDDVVFILGGEESRPFTGAT